MKGKYLVGVLVAVLVIAAMLLPACAPKVTPPEEVITLKCSHAFSSKMNIIEQWMWWADEVTKRTDGRIQFEWYHGGALSKPGEEREHCRTGLADMVGTSATWHATEMALWEMNGALPFQPSDTLLAAKTKWQLYHEFPELQNEIEKANMKVMFLTPYGDYHIISRRPLKTLDDIKGLKVAILGKQQPKWIEPVGAIPSFISGPARYENLEKGVVDASLMGGIATTFGFGHQDMCKYMLLCGLGQYLSFSITMNLDTWNKISPKDQKVMDELSEKVMFEFAPKQLVEQDAKYRKEMEEEFGVTFYTLSEEDRITWAQSLPNLAKEWVDEAVDDTERELRKTIWARFFQLTEKGGYEWPMDWSKVD